MPHLFDPFTVRSITLRNRIAVPPLCQYWSNNGFANDWHLVHLGSMAVGGAALVIAEATAVTPEGRITYKDAGLWNDAQIEPLARINRFVKEMGAVPGIQIAHAGRKAATSPPYASDRKSGTLPESEGGWIPVAPSAIPFHAGDILPHELTKAEIQETIEAFRACAVRALEAGYEWLEMHGAHGYLAHSFQSPITNHRTDEYGGSFENRTRFALEVARALRSVWPDHLPLGWRMSVSDWKEGGWTTEESIELAKLLKPKGVDLIDCSSGAIAPDVNYSSAPGWQVPLSEAVRRGANIPTAAVGLITEPEQADRIICDGQADLVLLGREMMRDPHWAYRAAVKLGQRDKLTLPPPYDYAVG
ncbi:MAG: NADH:flavin oxidoreductase/NADH oxidase [Chthonomonadaceae bacterium]|nr:NADH:flavin oxidoreductase/NADH oxidase [Chthonomonadaceae bacterium]